MAWRVGPSTYDYEHLLPAVRALLRLDLRGAYSPGVFVTSPPGYPLLATPLVALLRPWTSTARAYGLVGLTTPLWLAGAAMVLGRALGVAPRSPRELLLGLATLVSPGVPHAVLGGIGIFHPQDLAACTAMLLGLAAAVHRRWVLAGAFLGTALLCRQWALLALLPISAAAPSTRSRMAVLGAAAAVFVTVLAPFLWANPSDVAAAMIARFTSTTGQSLVGALGLPGRGLFMAGRGGPVIGAMVLACVLAWRWQGRAVPAAAVVAAALAGLVLRPLLDTALYPYYLAGVSAVLVPLDVARSAWPVRSGAWVLWCTALSILTVTSAAPPDLALAVGFFVGSALALVEAAQLAWAAPEGG